MSRAILFGTLTTDLEQKRERSNMRQEARMIKMLEHTNVIKLLHLAEEDEIALVFPLMET